MRSTSNRVTIGFDIPDGGKIIVRPNNTVRYYGRIAKYGQDWTAIEAFEEGRRPVFVILSVEVYVNKTWLRLEYYPQGKMFASLTEIVAYCRQVAREHGYNT